MSNKLINAVIALIEERPREAKEMLRSPELKLPIGEVQIRLNRAIEKREVQAAIKTLKAVLWASLHIDADKKCAEDQREAFLLGVTEVENIVEKFLADFESEVLAGSHTETGV